MTAPRNTAAVARARAVALKRVQQAQDVTPDFSSAVGTEVDPWADVMRPSLDDEGVLHDTAEFKAREMDEMLRTYGKARQLENILTLPLRTAEWELIPGKGERNGEAVELEELLRLPANNGGMVTPIDVVLAQLCSAIVYRRAYFEKEFQPTPDNRRIMYRGLWFRPASTVQPKFTPPGKGRRTEFDGFRQERYGTFNVDPQSNDNWTDIPARRALMYVHGSHRQPVHGVSDLDVCLWAWRLAVKLQVLWFDYLSAMALPRTLVWNADPTVGRAGATRLSKLRGSGVAYAGGSKNQGASIETVDTSGKGSAEYTAAMAWLEAMPLDSVLAGFTGMASGAAGKGAGGAYALSKSDTDLFMQSRQAELTEQAAFVTNFALPDLARLNWGREAVVPRMQFRKLTTDDVQPTLTLLGQLATAPQLAEGMPMEFIGELVVKAADFLNMDEKLIQEAVDYAQDKARERAAAAGVAEQSPAADVAAATGAVNAVSGMVQQAQAGDTGGQGLQSAQSGQ